MQLAAGPDGCTGPRPLHLRRERCRGHVRGGHRRVQAAQHDPRSQLLAARRHEGPRDRSDASPISRVASSPLPGPAPAAGSWPSFRGPVASGVAEDQHLPDSWNPATGQGVLWRTSIPGLAHSSPVVWGDLVFVTSAISGKSNATFKPGLYGDGDASDDRTAQRWMLCAVDKKTGKVRCGTDRGAGRAAERAPHQVHLRQRLAGHRRRSGGGVVRLTGRVRAYRPRRRPGGRSISGASTWAPTTSPVTSGGRRARRSSGTAS